MKVILKQFYGSIFNSKRNRNIQKHIGDLNAEDSSRSGMKVWSLSHHRVAKSVSQRMSRWRVGGERTPGAYVIESRLSLRSLLLSPTVHTVTDCTSLTLTETKLKQHPNPGHRDNIHHQNSNGEVWEQPATRHKRAKVTKDLTCLHHQIQTLPDVKKYSQMCQTSPSGYQRMSNTTCDKESIHIVMSNYTKSLWKMTSYF